MAVAEVALSMVTAKLSEPVSPFPGAPSHLPAVNPLPSTAAFLHLAGDGEHSGALRKAVLWKPRAPVSGVKVSKSPVLSVTVADTAVSFPVPLGGRGNPSLEVLNHHSLHPTPFLALFMT